MYLNNFMLRAGFYVYLLYILCLHNFLTFICVCSSYLLHYRQVHHYKIIPISSLLQTNIPAFSKWMFVYYYYYDYYYFKKLLKCQLDQLRFFDLCFIYKLPDNSSCCIIPERVSVTHSWHLHYAWNEINLQKKV